MHVTLFGAAKDVTGSCYLLETDRARILVDCGMFQGSARLEKRNYIPRDIRARELDAVVLTHGHLDHCGRLPLLVKAGFHGPILTTPGTADIAKLILSDAARIQADDAERKNRQHKRSSEEIVRPLFNQRDVETVCKHFRTVDYGDWSELANGIDIRLVEAGHILGSACIEMLIAENGLKRKLVFSGDLGQWNVPILKDPAFIESADVVFMESTYGDRDHRSLADTLFEFEDLMKAAIRKQGKILIPTFAVGRAQQILYHVAELFRNKRVPPIPIFLDSPMAIAATSLYASHSELMDEESRLLRSSGQLRKDLSVLKTCVTPEESKALNAFKGPCLILAGAGMCNAGRIMHHLHNCLNLPETTVIIVGYQVKGSLGRMLVEGATRVKIFGETVHVKATVRGLGGFSAHAGQSDLLRWLEPMTAKCSRIILTHGESPSMDQLRYKIKERFGLESESPRFGDTLNI